MTDAGDASQPVVAHLYLRYDCSSETLFALVLGVDGTQFRQTRPENAYIRIDGAGKAVSGLSGNNGTPPDFSWVNPDGTLADGFEGSLPLAPGSHTVWAHILRPDNSADGYQSVDTSPTERPARADLCGRHADPDGHGRPDAHADPDGRGRGHGHADLEADRRGPWRDGHPEGHPPADGDDRLERRATDGLAVDGLPRTGPRHRRGARPPRPAAPGFRAAPPLTRERSAVAPAAADREPIQPAALVRTRMRAVA